MKILHLKFISPVLIGIICILFVNCGQKKHSKIEVKRDTVYITQTRIDTVIIEKNKWAAIQSTINTQFYVGLNNYFTIKTNLPLERISVEVSGKHAKIQRLDHDKTSYMLRIKKTGKFTIKLFEIASTGKHLLTSRKIRPRLIHDPTPSFAGKRSGIIKKKVAIVQYGITAPLIHSRYCLNFKIMSFTLTTINKSEGIVTETHSKSYRFTKEQKKQLQKLKSGDKFYIENIKAKGPSRIIRKLGAMAFTIE